MISELYQLLLTILSELVGILITFQGICGGFLLRFLACFPEILAVSGYFPGSFIRGEFRSSLSGFVGIKPSSVWYITAYKRKTTKMKLIETCRDCVGMLSESTFLSPLRNSLSGFVGKPK